MAPNELTSNSLGGSSFLLSDPDALLGHELHRLSELITGQRHQVIGTCQLARGRNLMTHHGEATLLIPAEPIQSRGVKLAPKARGLSEARVESIPDPGRVRPSLILTSTARDQEPRESSTKKIIRSSALLETQTGHLIQSWVGVRVGQTILVEWPLVKVSPLLGSSHRGRRKAGHDDAREITVTTARDFLSKS
ncbi:hypothetical protein PanWU01x14_136670 [Parasponia andersonii]|uniref:Uncharacterized protein n=1 Tax=Parasponia andersonii TaxID=3476 RepID=A0A2P5CP11_PARAD|nr:hypothetical protein PanWU01x14_136670 [Parasponia andersonii]